MLDDLARISDGDAVGRNVPDDDAAGAYNAVVAD